MQHRTVRPVAVAVLTAAALSATGVASAAAPARCGGLAVTLRGTERADVLRGTARRDVIDARGGNDRVFGAGGDDVICAGAGDDLVDAGTGDDRVLGGDGRDRLLGGAGADLLDGGAGNDALDGGAGRDTLLGGAGADRLSGGGEADRLDGGAGSDVLGGGAGDDRLDGGRGTSRDRDVVSGGPGRDSVALRPGDRLTDRTTGDVLVRIANRTAATGALPSPPRLLPVPAPVPVRPAVPARPPTAAPAVPVLPVLPLPPAPPAPAPAGPAPAPAPAPAAPAPAPAAPAPAPAAPAGPVQAPPPAPALPSPVVADEGAVWGTVTGPDGVVFGAAVAVLDAWDEVVLRTTTDASGRFAAVLAAGQPYVVEVDATAADLLRGFSGDAVTRALAEPVVVPAGAVTRLDVRLSPGGALHGRVADGSGRSVDGTAVHVRGTDGLELTARAATAPDGSWTVRGLPAGHYEISVQATTADVAPLGGPVPAEVVVGRPGSPVVLQVRPAAAARGRVVDEAGRPVAGVSVVAEGYDGRTGTTSRATASTDAAGAYRLPGLPDGTYRISLRSPAHLPVEGLETVFVVTGTDVAVPDLRMSAGTSVSGRVVLDARPVGGVVVREVESGQATRTAVDGSFVLAGLAPGATTLQVQDPFGRSATATVAVDTSAAAALGVEVATVAGRTLRGRVTAAGAPLPRGRVEVTSLDGEVLAEVEVSAGAYVARGLPGGSVLVRAEGTPGADGTPVWAREHVGGSYLAGTPVAVDAAEVRAPDVDLDRSLATSVHIGGLEHVAVGSTTPLHVQVADQSGQPLPWEPVSWSVLEDALATVDTAGRLTGRAVGRVTVIATVGGVRATAVRAVVAS